MNVLIVDDQIPVAKGVESGVNWLRLGVDRVFLAYSMQQAQQVFVTELIDIIISDIEMPMGSGLDLIAWVREHHPRTECIFLTSHEDFEYAKAAIKLGSFDYLVQPIQYDELEKVVARVIEKITATTRKDALSELGRYWQDNASNVRESFWANILVGNYTLNAARLDSQAEQLAIDTRPTARYLPVLINSIRRQILLSEWDDELLKNTFINVLEEILFDQTGVIQVTQLDANHYIFILPVVAGKAIDSMTLLQKFRFFNSFCQTNLKISQAIYIGDYTSLADVSDTYQQLVQLDRKNVAHYSKVFTLDNREETASDRLEFPEISQWGRLLEQGHSDQVWHEVQAYFERKVFTGTVNAPFLARFQNEFLQMIWQISETRGVRNIDLLFSSQLMDHFLTSLENVENMLAFIRNIVTIPLAPAMTESDYQSTVEKVKAYVRDNLDRELSRNEIADQVFLNPEYLSRLFRKETGQSLIEYITNERIQAAIGYLVKTNMPVSLIASKVGHSNFSHFSKIFKKATGMTPNEYRQTHARK